MFERYLRFTDVVRVALRLMLHASAFGQAEVAVGLLGLCRVVPQADACRPDSMRIYLVEAKARVHGVSLSPTNSFVWWARPHHKLRSAADRVHLLTCWLANQSMIIEV